MSNAAAANFVSALLEAQSIPPTPQSAPADREECLFPETFLHPLVDVAVCCQPSPPSCPAHHDDGLLFLPVITHWAGQPQRSFSARGLYYPINRRLPANSLFRRQFAGDCRLPRHCPKGKQWEITVEIKTGYYFY